MSYRVLIEGSPQLNASTPAQTSVGTDAAVVLTGNAKRKGFSVMNTGTTVIKLAFGPVTALPTQTVYHVALKGGTGADDGLGSLYVDDAWVGDVWAISSAPGGTCVITEFRTGAVDWDQAYAYS